MRDFGSTVVRWRQVLTWWLQHWPVRFPQRPVFPCNIEQRSVERPLHTVNVMVNLRHRSKAGSVGVESLALAGLALLALVSFVAVGGALRASITVPTRAQAEKTSVSTGQVTPQLAGHQAAAGLRPIIALVDGFSSSQRLFGFSSDVVDGLRALGHDARRIDVGPYASPETNALALRNALADLAKEGRPIHAIAHSKGGVDLVLAAADPLPELRSVTTIASPHRGTSLVRAPNALFRTPLLGKVLSALLDRPLRVIQRRGLGNTTGIRPDIRGVVAGMAESDGGAIRLNPSVQYRTVAGYSGDTAKYRRVYESEFGPLLNPSRTRHWINRITSKMMGGPEDGVVTLPSSRLPDAPNVSHLGTFNGDHLRQVSDRQIIDVIGSKVVPSLDDFAE